MIFPPFLLDSIHSYIDSVPFLQGLLEEQHYTGIVGNNLIPGKPYCVINQISSIPEYNTGYGYIERVRVQVDCYANNGRDAIGIGEALGNYLIQPPLAISSGFVNGFLRMGGGALTMLDSSDANGDALWLFSCDYQATLTRQLPLGEDPSIADLNSSSLNSLGDF